MTKNLKWRLKELPDGEEVALLVEQKVITKEEARELLFSDTKQADESVVIKALKKQIEFLEGLVKELAKDNSRTVYVDRYIDHWKPRWPEVTWMSTTTDGSGISTAGSIGETTVTNYTNSLLN